MLPFPQFWAIIFFLMLFFLGLDSCVMASHQMQTQYLSSLLSAHSFPFQFVQLEAIISALIDEYPHFRKSKGWVTLVTCFIMWAAATMFVTRASTILYFLRRSQFKRMAINSCFGVFRAVCIGCNCLTGTRHRFPSFSFVSSKLSSWAGFMEWRISYAMLNSWSAIGSNGAGLCAGSI